jgi:hypothetical protein
MYGGILATSFFFELFFDSGIETVPVLCSPFPTFDLLFRYRYYSEIRPIYCDIYKKFCMPVSLYLSEVFMSEYFSFIHQLFFTGFRSRFPKPVTGTALASIKDLFFNVIVCGQVKLFALHGPGSAESVYCVCFIFCCIVSAETAHADPGPCKENNLNWPPRILFILLCSQCCVFTGIGALLGYQYRNRY